MLWPVRCSYRAGLFFGLVQSGAAVPNGGAPVAVDEESKRGGGRIDTAHRIDGARHARQDAATGHAVLGDHAGTEK